MDPAYYAWLAVLALGALLGLFLPPRTVGIFVAALVALAVAGLVVSSAIGAEKASWVFGLALMALPVLGLIMYVGSRLSNFGVRALARRRSGHDAR